jgi:hypothetical protein
MKLLFTTASHALIRHEIGQAWRRARSSIVVDASPRPGAWSLRLTRH